MSEGRTVRSELIRYLEESSGIPWDPGKEGREGWAICPCCGERELHIVFVEEAE